jgi:hypothetical protein
MRMTTRMTTRMTIGMEESKTCFHSIVFDSMQ